MIKLSLATDIVLMITYSWLVMHVSVINVYFSKLPAALRRLVKIFIVSYKVIQLCTVYIVL